jgi:ketosteroid isomerase-like protein
VKKIISAVIVFAISIQAVKSQAAAASQQAVQLVLIKMFDALSNRDSVALKKYCAADIVLFENGATWNLDTLILKGITLNKAADFKRINNIDFIQTEVNSNTAWITYNNSAQINSNGKQYTVQWLETVILIKKKKNWKIKLLHSTLVKRN